MEPKLLREMVGSKPGAGKIEDGPGTSSGASKYGSAQKMIGVCQQDTEANWKQLRQHSN